MLFNLSLAPSSSEEIQSWGLIVHIHLAILAIFLSSLTTSSSLTDQLSLSYDIVLRTHAEYTLPFAPKDKSLLANKG